MITVQASGASPNLPKPVDVAIVVDTYITCRNDPPTSASSRSRSVRGGRVAIIDFRKDSPEGPPLEFRFDADQIIGAATI